MRGFHPWYTTTIASFWKCQRWTFGTVPKPHSLYFAYRYNCLTLPRLDFWKIKASVYALFFSIPIPLSNKLNEKLSNNSVSNYVINRLKSTISKRTNSQKTKDVSLESKKGSKGRNLDPPSYNLLFLEFIPETRVQKRRDAGKSSAQSYRRRLASWGAEFVGQSLNSIGIGDSWINCATIAAGRTPTRVDAHRGGRLSFSSR